MEFSLFLFSPLFSFILSLSFFPLLILTSATPCLLSFSPEVNCYSVVQLRDGLNDFQWTALGT